MSKENNLLARSKTGGISLFSLLLLLAGLVSIGVQLVVLASGRWKEMEGISPFATGITGVLLLGLFAWTGLRRGEVSVYPDRVEGKSKAGKKYAFSLGELGGIDLRSKMLVLKDKNGKTVLVDSPPQDRRMRGLVWMLLNHELPAQVWEQFPEADEGSMRHAVRLFLHAEEEKEAETAEFMDQGLLVDVGQRTIYLPVQDTVASMQPVSQEKSLSTSLQASKMVLKFDPNPGDLPMADLAAALLAAPLEEKLRLSHFEMLVEAHGGAFLEDAGEGQWEGETSGWKIRVFIP